MVALERQPTAEEFWLNDRMMRALIRVIPDTLVTVRHRRPGVAIVSLECVCISDEYDDGVCLEAQHLMWLHGEPGGPMRIATDLANTFNKAVGPCRVPLDLLRGRLSKWRDRCARSRNEEHRTVDMARQERAEERRAAEIARKERAEAQRKRRAEIVGKMPVGRSYRGRIL